MNYEEKYKKSLKVMESLYNVVKYQSSSDALLVSQTIEKAFPELRESKDERIRKEILNHFNRILCGEDVEFPPQDSIDKWIAWLEKQGEQKPTPKFKIGDTIHKIGENTVFPRTIEKIEDGDYVCNNSHSFVNIKFQDDYELVEQKTDWSEEDEKMRQETIDWFEKKCFPYALENENPARESIKWLKSLKPQPYWKPTEEQMDALLYALGRGGTYNHEALTKLYNDLKKLRYGTRRKD